MSIKVVFVNNDGAGVSEAIELREGITLGELNRVKGTREGLACAVNQELISSYLESERVLLDGDKVVVSPTKIDAGE